MTLTRFRLLLVDDDPSAIRVMSRMLDEYPDQRFATSGDDALRLARQSLPDLILLDADMPGMTGFEVCRALKLDDALAGIPVIMITSHDGASVEASALEMGAVDFITKPFVASQLTARVRARLRNKLLDDELLNERVQANTSPAQTNEARARFLIVDDDVGAIRILRHALCSMGDFYFAKSGEEALHLARAVDPQMILLDVHMPGVDGFAVCVELKGEAAFRHVPIAFVTRFSDPRTEMQALDMGAADFIAKPFTPAVLRARIRNLLALSRRTRAELRDTLALGRRVADSRVADIVAGASDAIVSYDTENNVVLANAAAVSAFRRPVETVVGLSIQALFGTDLAAPDSSDTEPRRVTVSRGDGTQFPADISISQTGEAADRLTTVVLRDMTDKDRLEAQSRLRIEAETASRTKSLMMSYIAHEIGNPLNAILGFAELMAADTKHPLDVEQRGRLAHIETSGQRLKCLMRDVLDIGRSETGNLAVKLSPLEVADCVDEAASDSSELARLAGVSLSSMPIAKHLCVMADGARLHQCLLNLLTNAVKYNRKGGWVRVEVETREEVIEIGVRDNGIGMDDTQREHLFEPFNRLGRQGSAVPGTGLGLMITRQLVEAMHGRLRVTSNPGQGSFFAIELPAAVEVVA